MTKKQLQEYFRSYGLDSSYNGNERVLYIHGAYDNAIRLDFDTRGVSINFNL